MIAEHPLIQNEYLDSVMSSMGPPHFSRTEGAEDKTTQIQAGFILGRQSSTANILHFPLGM